jgi:hypothetical protein
VDGKRVRGSHEDGAGMAHGVSAWHTEAGVTLGQVRTSHGCGSPDTSTWGISTRQGHLPQAHMVQAPIFLKRFSKLKRRNTFYVGKVHKLSEVKWIIFP